MLDKVTKEIIYARLEEIRRLAELIRDAHHDCVFSLKGQNPGKQNPKCLIPDIPYHPPSPACGEPEKPIPAQVLDALQKLESSVHSIIRDFAKFYKLEAK
ncbi:MAG TPA: hypothetical protein VMG30_18910 [Acidobacteriota bacterium]|nr:hypothetical protein [Acidobacteriota bacterium]